MIGGSETGWVGVCLSCPDIGVTSNEGEGMVAAGVVDGCRDGTDGNTTFVAANSRRMRNAGTFGGGSVSRPLVAFAVALMIKPRSEWGRGSTAAAESRKELATGGLRPHKGPNLGNPACGSGGL